MKVMIDDLVYLVRSMRMLGLESMSVHGGRLEEIRGRRLGFSLWEERKCICNCLEKFRIGFGK